jgi:hypothetical protein
LSERSQARHTKAAKIKIYITNSVIAGLTLICLGLFISRPLLAAPFGDLWKHWDTSNEKSLSSVDHSDWQIILDRHLYSSNDGINRMDYQNFDPESRTLLKNYLSRMAQIVPTDLKKREQKVFWANLYNALTVDLVLSNPKKKTIKKMGKKLLSFGPWDDEVITVENTKITLNDIEHRILRPIWRDHRIHFVLNCASLGCPNLSQTALTSENIEEQMNTAERLFLNDPRGVKIAGEKLILSSLFDWYRDDFANSEKELISYIASKNPIIGEIQNPSEYRIEYRYDWGLNSWINDGKR